MLALLFSLLLLMQEPMTLLSTCPDLSGRYVTQYEDGRIYVVIRQTRCERIAIEWESSLYPNKPPRIHAIPLDGKFHPDSGWFGERGKQLTSAQFKSKLLYVAAKRLTPKVDAGSGWEQSFELLPDKDLCTKFFDPGTSSSSVRRASRQTTNNRAGEDEPARWSQDPC